jgi:vanillate O-demethylase ferredoxin subunit
MHALRVGDVVQVAPPENRFALEPSREEVLLLAGGIGVTPLISMAAELRATGRPFRFVYAGRSADQLAFLSDVETLAGRELTIHTDDTSGLLDVDALVRSVTSENTIYVCGPLPLIDATLASAREAGLESRVKFELFAEQAPAEGDTGFEVVLAESGARILVHPDQTILQALTAAGEEVMFDCERGDCGMCQMQVIEGVPDHRDYYLSETERRSNKLIQVCVSRSKTPVLVLAAP